MFGWGLVVLCAVLNLKHFRHTCRLLLLVLEVRMLFVRLLHLCHPAVVGFGALGHEPGGFKVWLGFQKFREAELFLAIRL